MKKVVWTSVIILLLNINVFAIDMVNTSFVDFVRFVSNSTNKNFIIDEKIDTKFNIILPHNFDSKDAYTILKSVLSKNNMYLVKNGTTYYIKKMDEKRFYSYKLKFLFPDKVIPIVRKYYPTLRISKSKKTVIYFSKYKEHKKIQNLIKLLDKPTKSKQIKVTLISYNDSDLEEYGVNIDTSYKNQNFATGYKTFVDYLVDSSSFFMNLNNFNLALYLSDLKTKQLVDSKFSPTISLFDGKPARFSITQKIPYLNGTTSINGANDIKNDSYSYNDVGSVINIDKVSITDDEIYFHIRMSYELILDKSITPTTSRRYIDNYLKLKDGQSVMIAGIKSDELSKVYKEIPLLSSIPLIGGIFKWQSNDSKKYTFAIIISSLQEKDVNASELTTKGVPHEVGKIVGERSEPLGYL